MSPHDLLAKQVLLPADIKAGSAPMTNQATMHARCLSIRSGMGNKMRNIGPWAVFALDRDGTQETKFDFGVWEPQDYYELSVHLPRGLDFFGAL